MRDEETKPLCAIAGSDDPFFRNKVQNISYMITDIYQVTGGVQVHLAKCGQGKRPSQDVDRCINYAISLRIRPKLMTAIGTIYTLTPLALDIDVGAQMQQPLSITLIGDL